MKIAHLVSTYPPYHGGMGNVAAAMHEELLKRGYDSLVLTPQCGPTEPQEGIKRVKPWFRFRNSAFLPGIGRYLGDRDIIHLHYPFYGAAEAVAWFKRHHPRAKLVHTYHMDTVGKGGLSLFFTLYQKLIQPYILRAGDVVTVSSRDYASASQLRYFPNLPIQELPFGVGSDFLPNHQAKVQDGILRLLFVGGLDKAHYFKGLSVLIEALTTCKPSTRLTVVGSGDRQSFYQEQARLQGVADRVLFAGSLSREALVKAYQSADITILPSIDGSEAFGLVLLESMACQTPVIASDLPGVRTLARQGKTGLVVPPKDSAALAQAIESLRDESLRTRLGQNAQALVEQDYRWPRIIDRLEAIYRGL